MLEVVADALPQIATLKQVASATRLIVRGRTPICASFRAAIGVALPDCAGATAVAGATAALWLGPDEWLVIAPSDAGAALLATLADALRAHPHAIVDVSDRQIGFEIAGRAVATVLAAGCPLDLDLRHFPVDRCTRTLLGKVEIVIWRTGTDRFRIEVARSFAAYATAFLERAVADWAAPP